MVKTPVELTLKTTGVSSRTRQSLSKISTASSSSATKKSRKKKKVCDQRPPWLQEQYLPLAPVNFLGRISDADRLNVANGRLARQQRRLLIRTRRGVESPQQEIQYRQETII
ncbi:unnamed protein product, partial [Brassica rapa subsp. trilocularis]